MSKRSIQRSIWFNLAFCVFLLGSLETYSWVSQKETIRNEGEYTKGYFTSDEILGYAPTKGKTVNSRRYYAQQLLYDVTYTIGDSGLRISPSVETFDDDRCILFFGGSFTFGEGVNDHEAMPYIVGSLSKYKVYNFGFHGYGPHQMLASIEQGVVEKTINCQPRFVIYQAITGHVARSAGYEPHDLHGPKYVLSDNGPKKAGHFDDVTSPPLQRKITSQLNKSYFYKRYLGKDRYTIKERDIRLFIEIVYASQNMLKHKFPKLEFHVVLWNTDPNDEVYIKIRDGLIKKAITLHYITMILPELLTNKSKYEISEFDRHPNALAHRSIAEYVVNNIILGLEQ